MLQLNDLDGDCLMEVLDRLPPEQLFKMLGINKRVNRLAAIKIRVKIKAIRLNDFSNPPSDCNHLHGITKIQVLVCSLFKQIYGNQHLEKQALFLKLLTKCEGVKCIDFGHYKNFSEGFLLEVVRLCPEIECLKLNSVEQNEWSSVLDVIGNKIIHFQKRKVYEEAINVWLLDTIAKKCPNIKRIDWAMNNHLTSEFLTVFKALPKSCQVLNLDCQYADIFEDIFDEIKMSTLDLSLLPSRVPKLSSLLCLEIRSTSDIPARGVDFVNLKKLQLSKIPGYDCSSIAVSFLSASRFPLLEELGFKACNYLHEIDYEALFQRMTTVKKLNIYCWDMEFEPQLPESAAIHHLKTLETIDLKIVRSPKNWQPEEFIQKLEHYVDEIKSLKKLTVKIECFPNDKWTKTVVDEIKRIQKKQESRVEVVLFCRIY